MAMTKKAEKTKEKLLQSARRLITERGYAAVSVEDITRASGMAKGTFYHYFQTKDEIVMEIIRQSAHDTFKEIMQEDASVGDKLFEFFFYFFNDAQSSGIHLVRQWMRKALSQNKETMDTNEQFRTRYLRVMAIIRNGVERGELLETTPVDVVARIMLSHVYGAVTIWCMMNGKWDLLESVKKLFRKDIDRLLQPYLVKK
jgi:AcrR family transcriptional regulator